jgi:O-acetyl-ADP-ribose deacetylase (regulator of RNase III)
VSSNAAFGQAEVELERGDITRFRADVIVNAANSGLRGGGGVDGAIHAAAGPGVMAELKARYAGCPTGSAVITGAGDLPARWIVHAVGPVWHGGTAGEAEKLASAYSAALDLAEGAGATSVAFPAISCGVYGYPLELAAPVALGAVRDWLSDHARSGVTRITFVLRSEDVTDAFEQALGRLASQEEVTWNASTS